VAFGKPVDQSVTSRRAELPNLGNESVQSLGISALSATASANDTVKYGGTYWAADSLRWEAIRDSNWTFDSGIGSNINTGANPNKPVGYHQWMEGWEGLDQSLNPLPYFRRSSTCAISGSFSAWAGVTLAESQLLCYAGGQGYGNAWTMYFKKTYSYPGAGNVTLQWDYAIDCEPGFDYSYVLIDTTGACDPGIAIQLASYTGPNVGHNSVTLTPGNTLPSSAGTICLILCVNSDGSYSDEDGNYPTTCGHSAYDNIALTGAITNTSTFEAGDDGWMAIPLVTGVGDFSNIVNRNTDLPPPVTFCACGVRDSVLVFYDLLGGHPLDQDNLAISPWINLNRAANVMDKNRPGKLWIYDVYAEMPLANYVFVQLRNRWYPSVCAATGLVYTTPFRDQNIIFYFGETPFCVPPGAPRLRDYSPVIETPAEQIQCGAGMINLCRTAPFGVPCTGVTNTTPWLDNVRLGIFGSAVAPVLQVLTFDFLQDNFAEDGSLNPASTGRFDANTLKNASTPGPGSILRDTLTAGGDGGNTEVRVYLSPWPGPFVNATKYNTWLGRLTPAPGIGPGWYCARMDTAEQGGTKAAGRWMATFIEGDPGFHGNDRLADPDDPSQLENEIFCDHVFTPGSRINYFLASHYIPPDPRNTGGVNWFVLPDTTGGNYFEQEILPSSMTVDSTWNCTLYVDHHHDRSILDQQLEEQGLRNHFGPGGTNCEGTRYDRFDNQTPSSGQLSFGRPLNTKYGCSIIQIFAYKYIAWHGAELSSLVLTDEDANIIGPWLKFRQVGFNGFWGSGSGIATSMFGSGEPSTVNFMRTTLGVLRTCNTIRDVNCPSGTGLDSTFCLPLGAVGGAEFVCSVPTSGRGNGCPDLNSFDLLGNNTSVPTAKGQSTYIKSGLARNYSTVTNHNTLDVDYKTVLDGLSVGRRRDLPTDTHQEILCRTTNAAVMWTWDVFTWICNVLVCRIPPAIVDVPGGEITKPPTFRAALGNAYPNPMNPTTRIQFTNAREGGKVTLQIFDVTGRLVKTLLNENMTAGPHEVSWDGSTDAGSGVTSGMYFYKMSTKDFVSAKKLVVMK
jgi:hypothetical protein